MPLIPRGEREAELIGRRLSALPPMSVFASTLRRAVATAEAIVRRAGGDLIVDPDLREIGCGELEGRPIEEIRAHWPHAWQQNERETETDFRWPGGESYREFRARCIGAIERIARDHPAEAIVVVTHTGVITQVMNEIHGLPPSRWSAFRAGNGSVTTIDWSGRRGAVVCFDDRGHLDCAHLRGLVR